MPRFFISEQNRVAFPVAIWLFCEYFLNSERRENNSGWPKYLIIFIGY